MKRLSNYKAKPTGNLARAPHHGRWGNHAAFRDRLEKGKDSAFGAVGEFPLALIAYDSGTSVYKSHSLDQEALASCQRRSAPEAKVRDFLCLARIS
jgi:hypothetical protein